MANTYVSLLHHVVFSTKSRRPLIAPSIESDVYPFMVGVVRSLDSKCLALDGTEDHAHMLVSLSKRVALADLIRQVKSASTRLINERTPSVRFGWQDGYGAFSVGASAAPAVADYIRSQKAHHLTVSFEQEYRSLLQRAGVEYDERYLLD